MSQVLTAWEAIFKHLNKHLSRYPTAIEVCNVLEVYAKRREYAWSAVSPRLLLL
jgi:hypothetical protein